MTTLSQMVDTLVQETIKPDLLETIVTFVNQTVRELHAEKGSGQAIAFKSNLVEVLLTATSDEDFGWEIPHPETFQKIVAVYYDSIGDYAEEKSPAQNLLFDVNGRVSWYRVGSQIYFTGYGATNSTIRIAYTAYPRRLRYFAPAIRPAYWDLDVDQFKYLSAFNVSDLTRADALRLSTNWLLSRWTDVVEQGVRAKVFARLKDTDRARIAFSSFMENRPSVISAEEYTVDIIRRT